MRTAKTQFWVFALVCITLSIALNLNHAFGATINVPTLDYPTIQAGIDAAVNGDTVLVAVGTYTGDGNKNLDFKGKAITLISENGPNNTIIDCEGEGRGFWFHTGEDENSILSGFTITNGVGGYPDAGGGGVYLENSSPIITDCIITKCQAEWPGRGGGIYCGNASSPNINNCIIRENSAISGGGGIYTFYATPTITNCLITENSALGSAGICFYGISSPTITDSTITGNVAEGSGGGIGTGDRATPIITNCLIEENTATDNSGGGIALGSAANITNCVINGNSAGESGGGISMGNAAATVTNCIITNNSATEGAGLHIAGSTYFPSITNCTISNNSATENGGGITIMSSSPTITNCIFWGDTPDEIFQNEDADPAITYCDVQNEYPGEGNFHGDPLFVDQDNGDYHLSIGSPCIYAATASGAPGTDIEDNPRPQGVGYDVGAYEVVGYGTTRPIIDSFSADTTEANVPFEVNFTCTAHDPDGEIFGYRMDYGDGSAPETNTTGNFTYTYNTVGMGYATCTVTDNSDISVNSRSIKIRRIGDIHVPSDYSTIQAAIDAALDGDIVLVASGIYKGDGNKNLDFKGKAITVRAESGPSDTIIDCESDGRGFEFYSGEGSLSVVSGFTIANGRMTGAGGISIVDSSPTITDCIISQNVAYDGSSGGIGCYNSSPNITDCTIIGNTAHRYGGGIGCFDSSPTISGCKIVGNSSEYYGGGGIACYDSTPIITNTVIAENSAWREGGGIYCNSSSPKITNCTVTGNQAEEGAGVHSAYSSHPIIINSIFWVNSPDEISISGGDLSVTYSDVRGGWPGEGNIALIPDFVDPANGNYRLEDYSICIGSGTTAEAPDSDIEGNPRPNPAGSNPDMGAYENSRDFPDVRPLDIFGIEIDNSWTFQGTYPGGSYTSGSAVILIDQTTFPTTTHVMEHTVDGSIVGKNWYETTASELKLWGEDFGDFYGFAKGLLLAWYPMQVGNQRYTSTTMPIEGLNFNVSMTANVLIKESIDLGFDTLQAYKLRYRLRVWGHGVDIRDTSFRWVVPYLGFVKYQDDDQTEQLTSFVIGSGIMTQETDDDGDGLKDYQELIIYNTNWRNSDTDDDGLTDGDEVNTHGTDPNNEDTDGDGVSDKDEIDGGRNPNNREPETPELALPIDGETDVDLAPTLETNPFSDTDGHNHAASEWQISTQQDDFSDNMLVFKAESEMALTSLTVPSYILDENTTYYWNARFRDDGDAVSEWAVPFEFTAGISSITDNNSNGIPDSQDLGPDESDLDLNDDGIFDDQQQSATWKCLNTVVGDSHVGIEGTTNVVSIDFAESIDPSTIADTVNRPDSLPVGLISFRLTVPKDGDSADVTIYLYGTQAANMQWCKWNAISGWQLYPASFGTTVAGNTYVELTLTDGGAGDADGLANGVIVDPSGAGAVAVLGGGGGAGGGSAGCFISTIASGFDRSSEILALVLLFSCLFMGLPSFRKKLRK